MRRYGQTSDKITMRGPSAGVKFGLTPAAATIQEALPCTATPGGLFWYNPETAQFDLLSEAALLEQYSDNVPQIPDFVLTRPPYRFHAQLQGELCLCADHAVKWRVEWNGSGENPPHYSTAGSDFFVYPRDDNRDESGVLTVIAALKKSGSTIYVSNEIYLIVTSASYYYTISQNLIDYPSGWLRLPDNYSYSDIVDNNHSLLWYGMNDGNIGIAANGVVRFGFIRIAITEIWVYYNGGGNGYYILNDDMLNHFPVRGEFVPPWKGGMPISIDGLTSIELHSDGYESPWYVFVK